MTESALRTPTSTATVGTSTSTAATGSGTGPAPAGLSDAEQLRREWATSDRWAGVRRSYSAEDVIALRGRVVEEHTLARRGAERLWKLLHTRDYVNALGALTGNQAVQQVKAGLEAIYLSGWQVAADANLAGQTYPDQSLYPANSVPAVVRRINNALLRADQIAWTGEQAQASPAPGEPATAGEAAPSSIDHLAPIVADAEAGFGGPLNAFELMTAMIAAGAAGVHWEDQLAAEKKCGHMGGKVLIPTAQHIRTLNAARLAADIAGVPSLIIARTDSLAATLITSDVDERDQPFLTGARTAEGFYRTTPGPEVAISRALAYAPYCDLIWVETSAPDLGFARELAAAVHEQHPGKLLAYNCSPSFNWRAALPEETIASFQRELGAMGYAFQFITLAGFHALNHSMFELSHGYARTGMSAYAALQQAELDAAERGYTGVRHQAEVGAGYFDRITTTLNPTADTLALSGSTEEEQF